jgi:hypothetical protein
MNVLSCQYQGLTVLLFSAILKHEVFVTRRQQMVKWIAGARFDKNDGDRIGNVRKGRKGKHFFDFLLYIFRKLQI